MKKQRKVVVVGAGHNGLIATCLAWDAKRWLSNKAGSVEVINRLLNAHFHH